MKTEHPVKNTHGGKRANAGPKTIPKGEHKKNLTVYVEQDFINELGGKKKLQEEIKEWIYGRLMVSFHKST